MSTFICSDLHLGHTNLATNLRGFSSVEEHDELIISNWNKVVNKRDKVFVLDDITMENSKNYYQLARLKGFISVVGGNHDEPQHLVELLKYVEHFSGCVDYKEFILTHIPIHPFCLNGKTNIFGHIHSKDILVHPLESTYIGEIDKRYFNVCMEKINYTPIEISEIRYKLKYG